MDKGKRRQFGHFLNRNPKKDIQARKNRRRIAHERRDEKQRLRQELSILYQNTSTSVGMKCGMKGQ